MMMNNKILWGVNVLLIAGVVYLFIQNTKANDEVVTIDSSKMLSKYEGALDLKKEIEKQNALAQSNIDTLGSELENEIKKFETERNRMSAKEIKLSEDLLRNKQQQFMQYQQAMQSKMTEEQRKMQEALLNKINAYINDFGSRHSYRCIIGANGAGNVLYADCMSSNKSGQSYHLS